MDDGGKYEKVRVKLSDNGNVSPEDVYLCVRVWDCEAEKVIEEIHKMGYACGRLKLV